MQKKENPIFYLLCGKARTGKDTFCDFMIEELEKNNKKAIELKCSKYIKDYAIEYFGWDGKEETKPRDFLNHLGRIVRDELNMPLFMPTRLSEDAKVLSYFFNIFIVSDVRFINEINVIKENFDNVKIIQLIRPNNTDSELSEKQKKDITETELDNYDKYDYIIYNDGTLEDLKEKAIKIVNDN